MKIGELVVSEKATEAVYSEIGDATFELETAPGRLLSGVLTIPMGVPDHSTSELVKNSLISERNRVRLRRTDLRIRGVQSVQISEHAGICTYSFGGIEVDDDHSSLTILTNELGSIEVELDPGAATLELVPVDSFIGTVEYRVWFGVIDGVRLLDWSSPDAPGADAASS